MKLYLIRHGESANNALLAAGGPKTERSPDPELTEVGEKQAALVGPYLASANAELHRHPKDAGKVDSGFGLTHLYCSLMTRAILTADSISSACGVQSVALPDIFERGGIYEEDQSGQRRGLPGPNRQYFADRFPRLALPDDLGEDGWYNREAETNEGFVQRMQGVVSNVKRRHVGTDDCVGMVVHGDFIDQFVNELMDVERHPTNYAGQWDANWAFHNTSISRVDFEATSSTVVYLNRIDHLTPNLVTW